MRKTKFKIISGGQTGADRAALDWAIGNRILHGGWCPKGRKAEDGAIAARYKLSETPTANYVQRTEWNIRDSDATVIFSIGLVLTGGARKTLELARKYKKPCLVLAKSSLRQDPVLLLRRFLEQYDVQILNIAGPRASDEPEVGGYVSSILEQYWLQVTG